MELFEFLSDEVIVQLGMLADYAMQIQGLVRICDDEELDEAELPQDIMAQETVLRSLFLDKACLNFPGFTKVALQTLKRPRTFVLRAGFVKTFGSAAGVSQAVVDQCFSRMRPIIEVSSKVIAAEYPEHDILHSFHVFALSGRSGRSDLHGQRRSEGQNEGLSRLARVFGICEQRLIEQFHRHEPYAAEHYARSKGTTIASWREAISRLGKGRKGNTADELTIVLIRYGAWVASTCDVERNFSKTSALRGGQCNDEFLDREENVIVLQTAPHLKEELVPAAIRVWVRHFGRPRQRKTVRIDAGVPRKKVAWHQRARMRTLFVRSSSLLFFVVVGPCGLAVLR